MRVAIVGCCTLLQARSTVFTIPSTANLPDYAIRAALLLMNVTGAANMTRIPGAYRTTFVPTVRLSARHVLFVRSVWECPL